MTKNRNSTTERILRVWDKFPDMRLGQLISNSISFVHHGQVDIFYMTDEQLASTLEEFAHKIKQKDSSKDE